MQTAAPTSAQELYQNSINLYHSPKSAEDIDLTNTVRKLLVDNGLESNVIQFYDSDPFITDSYGKHSSVQRYYQNRYWTAQLPRAQQSAILVRSYLINDGSIDIWLSMFEKHILPFIIANQLPTGL
jgi:hypothetical protein